MAYKDKKQQAKMQNKWIAENRDRISFTVPKGEKDVIRAFAKARGMDLNPFIYQAIKEKMERDN